VDGDDDPDAAAPGASGGATVAAEGPLGGASDGGAAGLNPGGGVVPVVSPSGGDCPGGPAVTPVGDSVGATGAAGRSTGGVAASSVAGPAGRTGAPTGAGGGDGACGRACSREVGPLTGASGAATGAGGGVGGGGASWLSVGCGVDGTAIAGLPAALVGACVTTRDCGTGFEPAGHRDTESSLELFIGRRDVVSSADRAVLVELSTGHRDVVFADGGITPSPLGATSTLSPCFVFDFGWTGFGGAAASARARAALASELSASNRGGSVGRLT
jgi:hypothetical protein